MSDLDLLRRLKNAEDAIGRLKVRESGAIYLSFAQRTLNPFPLASSGATWGDAAQPWAVSTLAFYASVIVLTTNDGSNYWTINLLAHPGATTIASVNTAAIAPNTGVRLSDTTVTQPASTGVWFAITATATGSPGAIYIFPLLSVARTG